MEKTKIKYEFYRYTETAGGNLFIQLPFKDFASIKFEMIGFVGSAEINNIYPLQNRKDATDFGTPAAKIGNTLILENNENEIDTGTYNILLFNQADILVTVKYIL